MKPHTLPSLICAVAVLLGFVVACGGKSAVDRAGASSAGSGGTDGSSAGSGATSGSNASGSSNGGSATGGSSSGPCPAAPPVAGTSCAVPYQSSGIAQCSYGDDPRPQCRTLAVCDAGTWQVSTIPCTTPPLPAACPTPGPSDSSACSDANLSCWYSDGARCDCNACVPGRPNAQCLPLIPPQWSCAGPRTGCPTVMPQAGTQCDTPNVECGRDCTISITCTDGVWHWGGDQCGLCAAPDTPIATPVGERPIASLRVGDLVYSENHDALVAVPLLEVRHTSVTHHRVVRVTLENGRVLEISPRHPTADGRTFGDLRAGSKLDAEHPVLSTELIPYTYDATFDILPASSTGTYIAAGALIGSTLFRH